MQAICDVGGKIALAVTLPDDKAAAKSGRIYLDDFCSKNDIPLVKSTHVNNLEVVSAISSAKIDWLFIVGWSQIAASQVLAAPRFGVFGMHPTLLPVGRGRAAIPWAILNDLNRTGVTLFKMDGGVDTGPVAAQIEVPMWKGITATELYDRVNDAHVQLMRDAIMRILDDDLVLTPQDHSKATVWPGRKPEDGEIDLRGSVHEAEKLVRAVTRPYPGAFFRLNGLKYTVWSAEVASEVKSHADFKHQLKFRDGNLLIREIEVRSDAMVR
jgi:methionyl-tRNA formyltransferase